VPHLHRNNAAEWVMVVALTPVAWIVRGWKKMRGNRKREPTGSAAGKSAGKTKKPSRSKVMIEGLPPRTMN
jgi:hypothetical protein